MISCCACNEANVDNPEMYSDHDELCKLTKYRCNQYECNWCDWCDAQHLSAGDAARTLALHGTARRPQRKSMMAGPRPGWNYNFRKDEKPRPPAKEAMDLPTTDSESF